MDKVKIIYEDNDVLLVEKPAFLVTTKERKNENNTLEDYLRDKFPNQLPRNGIVHRLDKGTSGLVLVAKTEVALNELKKQFKDRLVKKKYYALVGGDLSYDGTIDVPIGRSKYSFGKFAVNVDGKKARTEFKLISKYKKNNKHYSLVDIDLKTGRTHQIRVHFSYLRWPLVGDKQYGGETSDLNRPFLHAYFVSFMHPINKQKLEFNIDLANDLIKELMTYEKIEGN